MIRDNNQLSEIDASSINWNIRDDLKGLSLEDIKENHQPKLPFAVAMLNTTGSLNIGVALRTAVIFGARKFYIAGRRKYDRRSTVGAQNYINVERIDCYENETIDYQILLNKIKMDGYQPIVIEQGFPDITRIRHKNLDPICLILGEEKNGVPEGLVKECDGYSIDQIGVLRSLNVSVAAGIAMHYICENLKG